ncbi:hypothetical protein Z042_25580 [Chania multitudinisentens RB-25]|uniref:Uncharacterized protein n=1 Tax=Chania multitudinisentens RB-25 TaxID=1441930 RepID=A0A0D4ZYC0_9GAMM|nr:hypothetical protein Z042_25580 [Chania multitudinisentens RB-25]
MPLQTKIIPIITIGLDYIPHEFICKFYMLIKVKKTILNVVNLLLIGFIICFYKIFSDICFSLCFFGVIKVDNSKFIFYL